MAIERGIYGSLLKGIDKDRAGFQFYSYTPGYRASLEGNEKLWNKLTASYHPPKTSGYYLWLKSTERTNEDLEEASHKAEQEHPLSFSYRPVTLNGERKGVFCFAKDLGMDYTFERPLTPYHYSVVCAQTDIVKYPVLYCSSPSVCCDIFWGGLFHPDILKKKPDPLSYIPNLEADDPTLRVPHEAAFPEITQEDIRCFLRREDRLPVFCRMLKAVMSCKDGKDGRQSIVIADRSEYILYWIAAISSVFPLDAVRDLSFSTYGFAIEDFDINGVFVPDLQDNDMDFEEAGVRDYPTRLTTQQAAQNEITRYHFQKEDREHWVFDFSVNSFAPGLPIKQSAFMELVQYSVLDASDTFEELEDYKRFIYNRTNYRGIGSDYEAGYAFYCAMQEDNVTVPLLEEAVGFAIAYGRKQEQSKLLNIIYKKWLEEANNPDVIRIFRAYYQACEKQGVHEAKVTLRRCMAGWYALFTDKSKDDLDEFAAMGNGLEKLLGYQEPQLAIYFLEFEGLQSVLKAAKEISTPWKHMYLQRAIAYYVENGKGDLQVEVLASLLYQTARGIASASPSFPAVVKKTIDGIFSVLSSVEQRLQYLIIVRRALQDENLAEASETVQCALANLYWSADARRREQILHTLLWQGEIASFLPSILSKLCADSDPRNVLNNLRVVLNICGNDQAQKIKEMAVFALYRSAHPTTALVERYLDFFKMCGTFPDGKLSRDECKRLWDLYYQAFCHENPTFFPTEEALSSLLSVTKEFRQYVSAEQKNMILSYTKLWEFQQDPQQTWTGKTEDRKTYKRVELAKLPAQTQSEFLCACGEVCARYWYAGMGIVPEGAEMLYTLPKNAEKQDAENILLRSAFDYTVKQKKGDRRSSVLINLLEYLTEKKQDALLDTLVSSLPASGVQEKELIRQFERESRMLSGSRRSYEISISDILQLKEIIHDAYAQGSSGGWLEGMKSTLKGIIPWKETTGQEKERQRHGNQKKRNS